LSGFGSSRAYAPDGDQLEEVTVTAQKRAESSQDVPMTIYTVSADEMSKADIRNLFQLADFVPGMVFSRAPDDGMALTFRGIGSPARSQAFEESIGVFIDGIFLAKARLYSGGVIGPILIGWLIQRRRDFGLLLLCYAGVAVGLIGLAEVRHDFVMVLIAITVPATLVQVASLTLASLAPRYYPTLSRGTATGAAIGAARLGAICGPAAVGLLLSTGLRPSQVVWSLVPVALVAGLAAFMLLATGKLAREVPGEEAASSVVDSAYP
jgi:hypothetical protein